MKLVIWINKQIDGKTLKNISESIIWLHDKYYLRFHFFYILFVLFCFVCFCFLTTHWILRLTSFFSRWPQPVHSGSPKSYFRLEPRTSFPPKCQKTFHFLYFFLFLGSLNNFRSLYFLETFSQIFELVNFLMIIASINCRHFKICI